MEPTRFMLATSSYVKAKAERVVEFIDALCNTKGTGTASRLIGVRQRFVKKTAT